MASWKDRIELTQGDICLETVDVIVNAANDHLAHGGGVCGAITRVRLVCFSDKDLQEYRSALAEFA
jgi:O-acetyl-ADP-ribose deacetylase (regulator of RNase III)